MKTFYVFFKSTHQPEQCLITDSEHRWSVKAESKEHAVEVFYKKIKQNFLNEPFSVTKVKEYSIENGYFGFVD